MVKINKPHAPQQHDDGVVYHHKDCGITRDRGNACKALVIDGQAKPSILHLTSNERYTYFDDGVNFKLDLSNFGENPIVKGYFNKIPKGPETILMIFNQGKQHVHTFVANGYRELTKSTIIGMESEDLIDGLTTSINGTTYYNSRCDSLGYLECHSVVTKKVVHPTNFHVCNNLNSNYPGLTKVIGPIANNNFIINVNKIGATDDVDALQKNNGLHLNFKNIVGDVIHTVESSILHIEQIEERHISFENNMSYICENIETVTFGGAQLCTLSTDHA